MGLSLSQSNRKNRIGTDPRNTQWANDTDRFGHQQLVKMGWKPGRGLGYSVEGTKEHVKVNVKTDAKGLGHNIGQADQPTGLDVFQRILGKLNGNEEEVEEQIQKKERNTGLYLQFVPGGVLEGSVKSKKEIKEQRKSADKQKRKAEKQAEKQASKLAKQAKQDIKESKKSKRDEKPSDSSDSSEEKNTDSNSESKESTPSGSAEAPPRQSQARGIRATRNRYIAMKRQATADSQGLKEILML